VRIQDRSCGQRCVGPDTAPIDLAVGRGEIVGLAGLGGGQEAFLVLCGLRRPAAGDVSVLATQGRSSRALAQAAQHGIAICRATGVPPASSPAVFDNFAVAALPRHAGRHRRRRPLPVLLTGFRERLSMTYASAAIGTLSGGNQRSIARPLAGARARILLLNDPTRVDLGTRLKLYGLSGSRPRQGCRGASLQQIEECCSSAIACLFREQACPRQTGRDLTMDQVIAAMFGQETAQ
jgi:ABC-type sugar transport system ATPase subunit